MYKQFLVTGPRHYRFENNREFSKNTIITGILVDKVINALHDPQDMPLPYMGLVRSSRPVLPNMTSGTFDATISEWGHLTNLLNGADYRSIMNLNNRILIYRFASDQTTSRPLLATLRWSLPLWTQEDRKQWNESMLAGWKSYLNLNHAGPNSSIDKE